jgi:hypothetical protein
MAWRNIVGTQVLQRVIIGLALEVARVLGLDQYYRDGSSE